MIMAILRYRSSRLISEICASTTCSAMRAHRSPNSYTDTSPGPSRSHQTALSPPWGRGVAYIGSRCLTTSSAARKQPQAEGDAPAEDGASPSKPRRRRKTPVSVTEAGTAPDGNEVHSSIPSTASSKSTVKRKAKAKPDSEASKVGDPSHAASSARDGTSAIAAKAVSSAYFDPLSLTQGLPSPDGPWSQPRFWVVFSDLHVTPKTLETCLKVRSWIGAYLLLVWKSHIQ